MLLQNHVIHVFCDALPHWWAAGDSVRFKGGVSMPVLRSQGVAMMPASPPCRHGASDQEIGVSPKPRKVVCR